MTADTHDASEEIRALAREWLEAVQQHDAATLDRILAPEFTIQTTGGSLEGRASRADYLRYALGPYEIRSFAYHDVRIQQFGETAVMQSHYTQEAVVNGMPRSGVFWITDVWRRRDGRWQVVVRQSGLIMPS